MNKPTRTSDIDVPKVTTGPLPGSSKVYSSPAAHPDVRVPLREITLAKTSGEAAVRVYDPSGPYTDADARIDVAQGLPRHREAWIRERGGVEQYDGREVRPEDNGNVTGARLARDFPNKPKPWRAISPHSPSPGGRGQAGASGNVLRSLSRHAESVPPARRGEGQGGGIGIR